MAVMIRIGVAKEAAISKRGGIGQEEMIDLCGHHVDAGRHAEKGWHPE